MSTATLLQPTLSPVASMLRHSPLPDLRRLEVEEDEFEVVLTGTVSSYYLKQLAQETVRHVIGCRRLRNRVVVVKKTK
jgi:osmotically-inducible protein OsmY